MCRRLSAGAGLSRPLPKGGLPSGSPPSRRQMLSCVALWSVGRRYPPYPEFVLSRGSAPWTFGAPDTPQLSDTEVTALLFEAAQGARPLGSGRAALDGLHLDAPDAGVGSRMEACAAIWNEALVASTSTWASGTVTSHPSSPGYARWWRASSLGAPSTVYRTTRRALREGSWWPRSRWPRSPAPGSYGHIPQRPGLPAETQIRICQGMV